MNQTDHYQCVVSLILIELWFCDRLDLTFIKNKVLPGEPWNCQLCAILCKLQHQQDAIFVRMMLVLCLYNRFVRNKHEEK